MTGTQEQDKRNQGLPTSTAVQMGLIGTIRVPTIISWDVSIKSGEGSSQKLSMLDLQMGTYFEQQRCFSAFSPPFQAKVYFESEMQYDTDEVDQAILAWNIIVENMFYPSLVDQITMVGIPSETRDHMVGQGKARGRVEES